MNFGLVAAMCEDTRKVNSNLKYAHEAQSASRERICYLGL
jgi:hypothetical protein